MRLDVLMIAGRNVLIVSIRLPICPVFRVNLLNRFEYKCVPISLRANFSSGQGHAAHGLFRGRRRGHELCRRRRKGRGVKWKKVGRGPTLCGGQCAQDMGSPSEGRARCTCSGPFLHLLLRLVMGGRLLPALLVLGALALPGSSDASRAAPVPTSPDRQLPSCSCSGGAVAHHCDTGGCYPSQATGLRLRGGGGGGEPGEGATRDHSQQHDTPQWLKDLEAELRQEVDAQGNTLSKNELKRRLKAAQKEREKLEQPAAVRGTGDEGGSTSTAVRGPSEDELDPNQYFEHRCAALEGLIKQVGPLPYSYQRTLSLPAFRAKYDGILTPGQQDKQQEERIAGRVMNKRQQGKLVFYQVQGDGAKLQIMASEEQFTNVEEFKRTADFVRRGDVVGVEGFPGMSQKGELSIFAKSLKVLAPCLRMIPKLSLTDPETRYRQRYLDLIINPDVRKTFQLRSHVIQTVRQFLLDRDFLEVEMPMCVCVRLIHIYVYIHI
jgi:hypothetical protein